MRKYSKLINLTLSLVMIFNLFLVSGILVVQAEDGANISFFIAPNGNDSNTGTIDSPFATLEKARDAIRELKNKSGLPEKGVTVYLRAGEYVRNETFVLEEKDSGTANAPITYRAYMDEKVSINGAKRIDSLGFKPVVEQSIIEKLPVAAKGKVMQIDLKAQGITDFGEIKTFGHTLFNNPQGELIFNDNIMTLARWPNKESVLTGEPVDQGSKETQKGFVFHYEEDRAKRWTQAKDAWMYGYWWWDWSDQAVPIESIDTRAMTIKSKIPHRYGVRSKQRYYVFNLLEEIDMPGEYYLNRETGILYFYPPGNLKDATISFTQFEKVLIEAKNTQFINFRGLTLGNTRGKVINISGGNNNLIYDCTISNAGVYPVVIKGKNNGILSSTIYGVASGIILGSMGEYISSESRKTLSPSNNFVENCEIYNFSRRAKTYSPAITLQDVGSRVSNNKIYDAPHTAIMFFLNDHIIENNEIFNVCYDADDMGAIYSGRSHTWWGTKIRNNYFHDIHSNIPVEMTRFGKNALHAIYLDDTMSGVEITGNIFENVNDALAASGSDIIFKNNIIIDSKDSVWWKGEPNISEAVGQRTEETKYKFDLIKERIEKDLPFIKSDVWMKKYPNLLISIEKTFGAMRNVVENNVLYNTPEMKLHDNMIQTGSVNNNLVINEDLGFVDKAKKDLRLKEDSVIYKKIPSFEKIQFERMGLYSEKIKERIKDSVALLIGSPKAYVKNSKAQVDNNNADVMPVIKDGRTLVPVRFISESFGAQVGWDGATSEVSVTLGEKIIKMQVNSKKINVNGNESELDVPAQVINERTLIPLRALVEALGKKVMWDPQGLIIISEQENLFDTNNEQNYIDEVVRQLNIY